MNHNINTGSNWVFISSGNSLQETHSSIQAQIQTENLLLLQDTILSPNIGVIVKNSSFAQGTLKLIPAKEV